MSASLLQRITVHPSVCHGRPTVRGLRYPVTTLLDLLSSDMTSEEILADFPDLEEADLKAVIAYASAVLRSGARLTLDLPSSPA